MCSNTAAKPFAAGLLEQARSRETGPLEMQKIRVGLAQPAHRIENCAGIGQADQQVVVAITDRVAEQRTECAFDDPDVTARRERYLFAMHVAAAVELHQRAALRVPGLGDPTANAEEVVDAFLAHCVSTDVLSRADPGAGLVAIRDAEDRLHPLVGLWRGRVAPEIALAIQERRFQVRSVVRDAPVQYLGPADLAGIDLQAALVNLNRRADLDALGRS